VQDGGRSVESSGVRLWFDHPNFSPMTWIWDYFRNVAAEMEKVNWPGRDELISSTLITIVATMIISGFIFLSDQVIQRILEILYRV